MDNEKYSLRHRQKRKPLIGSNGCDNHNNDFNSDNSMESSSCIGGLNDTKNVIPNEQGQSQISVNTKIRTKSAPLSKYRRKTANARERSRMREINSAFENLRHCVPTCITSEDASSTNEKLTKITTLRLAMKYIRLLATALRNPDEIDCRFLYDCTHSKEDKPSRNLDNCLAMQAAAEKNNSLLKVTKIMKTAKVKMKCCTAKKVKNVKTINMRRINKKQTFKQIQSGQSAQQVLTPYTSPISLRYQESPASNASSSAYASMSSMSDYSNSPQSNSSYAFESHNINHNSSNSNNNCNLTNNCLSSTNFSKSTSLDVIGNIMLESDGESMNLSEGCLNSPLPAKGVTPMTTTTTAATTNIETTDRTEDLLPNLNDCVLYNNHTERVSHASLPDDYMENPFEFSLHLMESSTQDVSMPLCVDQPNNPSTSVCINPLIPFDPLTSFDLFHSDLTEQTPLDLFLT